MTILTLGYRIENSKGGFGKRRNTYFNADMLSLNPLVSTIFGFGKYSRFSKKVLDDMEVYSDIFIPLASASLGALLGGLITGLLSYRQFEKSQRIDRFLRIVNEIEIAMGANESRARMKPDSKEYADLTDQINVSLNHVFSNAMVFLPDDSFAIVRELLDKKFDKEQRNLIYHHFRVELLPDTTVAYEDIKSKFIKIK